MKLRHRVFQKDLQCRVGKGTLTISKEKWAENDHSNRSYWKTKGQRNERELLTPALGNTRLG